VSLDKKPPTRSRNVHTPVADGDRTHQQAIPTQIRFAVGTDRARVIEPAPQAVARRGGDLPDLFDAADVDGAPTDIDLSVRMMPVRRSRELTRLTPINEETIWARSLQQAKASMGKPTRSTTPAPTRVRMPRGTPPIRLEEPARAERPVRPEPPARLDKPTRVERPLPVDMMPTMRTPAPPALEPPPRVEPHQTAQVIDLAAARRERAASINSMPIKAPPVPPPVPMPPPMPMSQPMPASVGQTSGGPAAATGVASAMAAAPGLATASAAAAPQPYWNPDPMPVPPMPMPAPAPVAHGDPYAVYQQIGLGAPVPVAARQKATQAVVSAYRGLGFVILTIIVVVLVGYIATSVFYMVSDSWIEPMVVSPTDERVLTLKSQLAEKTNLRDQVALELQHTERFITSQQEFQSEFVKAVKADLAERKTTLRRLRALANGAAGERSRIRRSNREFARQSKAQIKQEYAARLIDRNEFLAGAYQLGQIANSSLTLAERQAEFETRASEIDGEARALEAILNQKQAEGDGSLSYEVLKVKQEYDSSRLETLKAIESRAALKESLARYDAIIQSIKRSPYLRAADHTADVAFVPYGNLDDVEVGSSVYSCALEMIVCHQVGSVRELLPGEVTFKHPFREKDLRGQMVELDLDDDEAEAVAKSVLFVGGRPLLF